VRTGMTTALAANATLVPNTEGCRSPGRIEMSRQSAWRRPLEWRCEHRGGGLDRSNVYATGCASSTGGRHGSDCADLAIRSNAGVALVPLAEGGRS
jgi:hypothetical protein